jgi:hypothetical protein
MGAKNHKGHKGYPNSQNRLWPHMSEGKEPSLNNTYIIE